MERKRPLDTGFELGPSAVTTEASNIFVRETVSDQIINLDDITLNSSITKEPGVTFDL